MGINALLQKAQHGELDACAICPWSPKVAGKMAFGVSCNEHGINWEKDETATSMIILQDPGGTTPERTGRLCTVHNSKNQSDKTAQQGLDLWKAAVSLDFSSAETGGFLRHHYWTNATMHGASKNKNPELAKQSIKENARSACNKVLEDQIKLIKPKVIIAGGVPAVRSLNEIKLLNKKWDKLKSSFIDGVYKYEIFNWHGNSNMITVFCTYHTSATAVNTHCASRYRRNITEKSIVDKAANLPHKHSVINFLEKYNNVDANDRDKGMRYLLNHWLDIGSTIREIIIT